jgi:hypothetical protein
LKADNNKVIDVIERTVAQFFLGPGLKKKVKEAYKTGYPW